MQQDILYSIVVPVYGVESYLNQCVDSLLAQTYRNIEIILVDDGAVDGSPAICDDYAARDSRVKVIHKENGGLVSARKAGAEQATGVYVCCVDGDDWLAEDYIERIHDVVCQYNPEIVCAGLVQSNGQREILWTMQTPSGLYEGENLRKNIRSCAIENEAGYIFPHNLCGKAILRELYLPEQLAVDNRIKIGEDAATTKPILTKCRSVYVMDAYLYYYRYNLDSMTKKKAYDWNGPRYIEQHLLSRIDITQEDYLAQIYRRTARDLFSVAYSQFYRNEPYKTIKQDIVNNINAPDYKEALEKCDYTNLKCRFEMFLLKHHLFGVLYLHCKTRKGF